MLHQHCVMLTCLCHCVALRRLRYSAARGKSSKRFTPDKETSTLHLSHVLGGGASSVHAGSRCICLLHDDVKIPSVPIVITYGVHLESRRAVACAVSIDASTLEFESSFRRLQLNLVYLYPVAGSQTLTLIVQSTRMACSHVPRDQRARIEFMATN